jgi:hypothetical protein
MWDSRWLARLAALMTMSAVLYVLGVQLEENSWALWSILALSMCLEHLAFQHGVASGIEIYASLTPAQKLEIEKMLKDDQE